MAVEIGIKLQAAPQGRPDWEGRLGEVDRVLGRLKAGGAAFAEIAWGDDGEWETLTATAARVLASGLGLSVHPYLHAHMAAEVFDRTGPGDGHRRLVDLLTGWAGEAQAPVTAVFHGGLARHGPHHRPLNEATAAARAFFAWLGETTAGAPGLGCFAETQMPYAADDEAAVRLGDTYDSCLHLVAGTGVGVCWDMGHAYYSAALGKHAPVPPEAFLQAVGHVHIHDARFPDGDLGRIEDHLPLGEGMSPWRVWLRLLAGAGFAGRILLEVDAGRFADAGEWAEMVSFLRRGLVAAGLDAGPGAASPL